MSEEKRQSPVDLDDKVATFDAALKSSPLVIKWHPDGCQKITNGGYTWTVACADKSTFNAPHLTDTYRLVQFHAHWGYNAVDGSEHTFNGKECAAEVHFVHYKASYGSLEEAVKHGDGLAVLGVMLEEVAGPDNADLKPIISHLKEIKNKGEICTIPAGGYDLNKVLPKSRDFYTYEGSLTTPPFTECVIWTVLREPVPISTAQLSRMRAMKERNVREVFPLHGRKIRKSFQ